MLGCVGGDATEDMAAKKAHVLAQPPPRLLMRGGFDDDLLRGGSACPDRSGPAARCRCLFFSFSRTVCELGPWATSLVTKLKNAENLRVPAQQHSMQRADQAPCRSWVCVQVQYEQRGCAPVYGCMRVLETAILQNGHGGATWAQDGQSIGGTSHGGRAACPPPVPWFVGSLMMSVQQMDCHPVVAFSTEAAFPGRASSFAAVSGVGGGKGI